MLGKYISDNPTKSASYKSDLMSEITGKPARDDKGRFTNQNQNAKRKSLTFSLRRSKRLLLCNSLDSTLRAILSNGVATVRQTLSWMFSAMADERAKKRRKLVLMPGFNTY